MSLRAPLAALALLLSAGVVHGATPSWRLPWGSGLGQVARSASEGHQLEQSRRPPQAFALDREGNLIVADTFNKRILRIPPAGPATVLAPGTTGALELPGDLALHPDGRLLVADRVRFKLVELGSTERAYGERGEAPPALLDVSRVAWGPGQSTAAADDVGHRLVFYEGGKPQRSREYRSYGLAFDPRGNVVMPDFAALSGFVLTRQDPAGRPLPTLPFDLATPLTIELLSHDAAGIALALVPVPNAEDGRQELLQIEPGGRTRHLWTGQLLDAARTFATAPDGRLYRATESEDAYSVAPLEPSTAATLPTTDAARTSREILRIPATNLGTPTALVQLGPDTWLIGEDGRWARARAQGPASWGPVSHGRLEPAPGGGLSAALAGPAGALWVLDARDPVIHAYDAKGVPRQQIALAGWDRVPDLVTASPEGQILAHDRLTSRWIKHDIQGKLVLRFDQVATGALDGRSELVTLADTDETFGKAVVEFDSNGNFFKALTTFNEPIRPSGARFLGNAPGGDLLIGYWLGPRGKVRRLSIEGEARGAFTFDLPPGARSALAPWAIGPTGEVLVCSREGNELVVRAFAP